MCQKYTFIFLSLYFIFAIFSSGSARHSKGSQNIFNFKTPHDDQAILKRHKRGLYGVEKSFFVKAFKALDSHQGTVGKPNGYEVQFNRLSNGASRIDWRLISGLGATGYTDAVDKVTSLLNTALRFGNPDTRKFSMDAAKLIPGVVKHRDSQLAPYIAAGTQDPKHIFMRNHWNQKWAYFQVLADLPPPLPALSTTGTKGNTMNRSGTSGNRGRKA